MEAMREAVKAVYRNQLVIGLIVLLILSILMWREWWSWKDAQQRVIVEQRRIAEAQIPIQVLHNQWIEQTMIVRGGILTVHYDMSRKEACRVIISRLVIHEPTHTLEWTAQSEAAEEGVGEHLTGIAIVGPLPTYIGPGEYTYRSIRYNADCVPSGRSFTLASEGIPFSIVESLQRKPAR